jgi:hypothetical protein
MVLYFLVGIEILKQRRYFKALDNEFVTLNSVNNPSLDDHHNVNMCVIETVDANMMQPISPPSLQQGKELAYETSMSAASSSRQTPADSIAFDHEPPRRQPVSFRQYMLMPLMFFFLLLAIWVAPTVNRIASLVNPNFVSYPLYLAVGSMGSLRGFWNGIVFIVIGMKERKRQKQTRAGS